METKAFQSFFHQHYRPLCNYCYQIVGDIDIAEDCVQEAFIDLWEYIEKMPLRNHNYLSLIYIIVKNNALQYLRKNKIVIQAKDHLMTVQENTTLTNFDMEDVQRYENIERLYVSIRHLPPKCREVFVASKINGLSYTEIAQEMKISTKTVENHINKAYKLLRGMLR